MGYEPNYIHLNEIYIQEIVLDAEYDSEEVTIYGYHENADTNTEISYGCNTGMLSDLIIAAKEDGELIADLVASKLDEGIPEEDPEEPIIVYVMGILGKPLKISNVVITIYRPMEQDESGMWKEVDDKNFYFIDNIETQEKFEQSKTSEKKDVMKQLYDYLITLDIQYKLYTQLLALDIKEKEARKRTGLKDEVLYRIAVLNHQLMNKS